MTALGITSSGSPEGRDRLWRLLNIVLVAGSVAATVLAVGVVIALFLWLYTLPPLESERPVPRNPPPRQAPPQAPDPGSAPAPPPPAAVAPAAGAPNAVAPAEAAPPEAAEPGPSASGRRSRRAVRRAAPPAGEPGAPAE